MKFKSKALASSFLALCMVMAHAPYAVFAGDPPQGQEQGNQQEQLVEIEIGNTTGIQSSTPGQVVFGFEHGTISVSEQDITAEVNNNDPNNTRYFVRTGSTSLTFVPTADQDYTARVWSNGQDLGVVTNQGFTLSNLETRQQNPQANYRLDFFFESANNQGQGGQGQGGQGQEQNNFDGNAYFFWVGTGNKLCYHKFTGLVAGGGENVNYINAADLTDQSVNNIPYTWGQENANWALATDVEENGNIKPNLTIADVFGNGQDDMGCQLDPCGAEDGANTICTNGDMNFRATIYREDKYEGLTFGVSEDDYTYFPGFWDPTFFNNTVDISETTPENPALYETYLLEPSVKFRTAANSKSPITSVKALEVNEEAVQITKNPEDGSFSVTFNSNFYDKVVFELQDAQGSKYYIRLARITLTAMDNFAPNETHPKINAMLYIPSNTEITDYQVIATVHEASGNVTKPISPELTIPEGDLPHGKNLKVCQASVDLSSYGTNGREILGKVKGIHFTVIKKGALEGENYGGTFSGSGKGAFYDIEARRIVYDQERGGELV